MRGSGFGSILTLSMLWTICCYSCHLDLDLRRESAAFDLVDLDLSALTDLSCLDLILSGSAACPLLYSEMK